MSDLSLNPISEHEEQLRSLIERAESQERAARRKALLYSLVPAVLAILLLTFTIWQIGSASHQVMQKSDEVALVSATLENTQNELNSTNQQLGQAQERVAEVQDRLTETLTTLTETTQALDITQNNYAQAQEQLIDISQELTKTIETITQTRTKLADANAKLEQVQQEFDQLNSQMDELNRQLQVAARFRGSYYNDDLKMASSNLSNLEIRGLMKPGTAKLFDFITGLINTPWKIDGASPKEGLNSPTFAAYVLREQGLLKISFNQSINQETLKQQLAVRKGAPQIGDVIFYPEGYTMFYFVDENKVPFVIGMTPLGVVALRYDFATPISIGVGMP